MKKTTWNKLFDVFKTRLVLYFNDTLSKQSFLEKSWRMVLFVSVLAILMIYSAHQVDQKVVQISRLNESLKDLRSRHIDIRTNLTSLSKITRVAEEVKILGLSGSMDAPYKIEKKD
jgi:cell division protein FtsL